MRVLRGKYTTPYFDEYPNIVNEIQVMRNWQIRDINFCLDSNSSCRKSFKTIDSC